MPGIGADAKHAADMVQDDRRVGKGAGEIDRVGQLRMVLPRFEAEAQRRQLRKAFAEFRVADQMRRHGPRRVFLHGVVLVPRHTVADAAKPPAADPDLGLQHLAHPRTQRQIGMTDNRFGDPARPVAARCAHRRDAVDKLDLAKGRHLGRPVLFVHRAAFEKDGRNDVVAAAYVVEQFRQQIPPALRRIPEMVVRIDDRQLGLERRLPWLLCEPPRQRFLVAPGEPAIFALGVSRHITLHP